MRESVWASRPADLYGRRERDRLGTVLWGLRVVTEGLAALSRWKPSRVKPVRRTQSAVITKRELVARDVVALTLADPDGGVLPRWTPGAHIDVALPSGRRRQYSLCGPPGRRTEYRIAVRRIADGRGGSIEMHDAFDVGDVLTFEGPCNAFYLGSAERDVLFVIGGIGVTPILPMIRAAQRRGIDWRAVYAGRGREYMPFLDEMLSVAADRVTVWADDERGGFAGVDDLLPAPVPRRRCTCAVRAPCWRPYGWPAPSTPTPHCITSGSARPRSSTAFPSKSNSRGRVRCSAFRRIGRRWTSCSIGTPRRRTRAGKDSAGPAR